MSIANCPFCAEAPAPLEQFYETKLFRVLIARNALAEGHVVIMTKEHNPHFYTFTTDDIDEFGYLLKKVSFWVMRLTHAPGFSMFVSDGASEVLQNTHLQIHIIPRQTQEPHLMPLADTISQATKVCDDDSITKMVQEMQGLMQMPQDDEQAG